MNIILKKEDKQGNALVFTEWPSWVQIDLHLAAEEKPRHIAQCDHMMQVIRFQRDSKKHLFQKTQSYGFCHDLVSMQNWVTIVVNTEKDQYVMSRGDFLKAGKFLHFQSQGFETQIFVPVEILSNYAMEPF